MSLVFYLLFVFLFLYSAVIVALAVGFIKTKRFSATNIKPQTPVSIIICARNEEKNISLCLKTIVGQNYERAAMQIILVDDASADGTATIAENILKHSGIAYKIISNTEHKGKKRSITEAMNFTSHRLIVLRDADTFITSTLWLQTISDFFKKQGCDLIIGPVQVANSWNFLWGFEAIETNVLSVFTTGSAYFRAPFLSNGANLIFTKSIFEKTAGFGSHLHIASGDDILFMEDVKKIPDVNIAYLKSKDAIVLTYPARNLKSFLAQRIRWVAKFRHNKNWFNALLAVVVFVVNASWLFCFFHLAITPAYKIHCLLFVAFKLVFDFLLLLLASGFMKNKHLLWLGFPVGCVYPVYAFLLAPASLFIKPKWKS